MEREDATFTVDGTDCAAWVYRPAASDTPPPCVILAHGFSGVRGQRLDAYAERFAAAGLACLVFDYRHFGDSGGEPRQLIDIGRQLADWRAAVAFARTVGGVDRDRIALWGSSFSGGHVMTIAAEEFRIAAVVAQLPFADGLGTLRALDVGQTLKLTREGLRDQAGALAGRPPHTLPAVGPPGSASFMTAGDAQGGFAALTPADSTWRNAVAARVALRVGLYRPGRRADRISCPILFCVAEDDLITPPQLALAAAARARRAEVIRYPGGHFEIYVGEPFERAVADQIEFLTRHLLSS